MSLESQSAKQSPQVLAGANCGNRLPRWIFLRGLGLVYFIAFTSFWVQAMGLIGTEGIAPADVFLTSLQQTLVERPELHGWQWPTLFWFLSPANDTIHIFCLVGTVLSIGLLLGFMPRLVLLGLWAVYLSIFNVSSPFLGYQWDILLLEVTVLAFFYAPGGLRPSMEFEREPNRLSIWLLRLVLFKFIISSGLVKLNSGDPTWQDLTALDYHFWTQPIPHQMAWYAHNGGAFFRFHLQALNECHSPTSPKST